MPEPLTYQVLRAAQTSLERIAVASGYQTDAGAHVLVEGTQEPDGSDVLLVVTLDAMTGPQDPAVARLGRVLTFKVTALVPALMDARELTLHQVLDDIDIAMADQQTAYPDRCSFPRFVSVDRLPPTEGLPWIGAHVRFSTTVRRAR